MGKITKKYEEFSKNEWNIIKNNNLTYLNKFSDISNTRKLRKPNTDFINDLESAEPILNLLRNYNIDGFQYKNGYYLPDNNFKTLITSLNIYLTIPININDLKFDFETIDVISGITEINITSGIPNQLIGYGIGYKLYKKIIKEHKIVISYDSVSAEAENIWYKLMFDKELMAN